VIARRWRESTGVEGTADHLVGVCVRGPLGERLAQATIDATAALVLICDGDGRILLANPALQRFTGQPDRDLIGRSLWDVLVIPEEVSLAREAVTEAMKGTPRLPKEVTWLAAGGRRRQVELQSSVLLDGDQACATAFIGIDVTEQREREAHLRRRAATDSLTGVANRGALFDELARLLAAGSGGRCGVLFCDLDDFKTVNDRYGHRTGDRVLVEAAARLQDVVEPDDLVARVGGDEFVVLRPKADHVHLTALAKRIEERMRHPFDGAESGLHISVSIGAALGRDGEDVDEVMARADFQMYGEKAHHYRTTHR
jgi:diguanylate cyclase (GGDEF)-like protein/PAS domain S-box-containing protein